MSRMHPSSTNLSPTKAIDFDRFYGDGSFLKLLQETLQKNASVLKQGVVKLALSPIAIAYLNDRLHATLCPKRATDNSGRVDGWTIRESAHTHSFLRVVSPRKRDIFNDDALVPVGHLDVLKLSTLLTETTCVKVTGTHEQPSLSMAVVYFNIFPSLKRIELNRLPVTALDQLACFVAQLEHLDMSFNALDDLAEVSGLSQVRQLQTLKLRGNPLAGFPDYRRQVHDF
ncbi:hypothetical protein DYB30_003103 [Aphanomyces astaci]|uniref:Leucine-rich repeat-containing protein 51 n=1 Tax=Aphanomyces astaci TaxID=112090 RepID=A0A397DFZ1_APHAT|nr:hypothetical protein DYB30_003103 [Aphanomyces astaci]